MAIRFPPIIKNVRQVYSAGRFFVLSIVAIVSGDEKKEGTLFRYLSF